MTKQATSTDDGKTQVPDPAIVKGEEAKTYTAGEYDGLTHKMVEWRNKYKEAETNATAANEELAELRTKTEEAESEKENADLLAKGEYDKALDGLNQKHQKATEGFGGKITALEEEINVLLVDNAIIAASANEAVNPKFVKTLMKAAGMVKMKASDGKRYVETFEESGIPMIDDEGKPAAVEFAVKKFLADNPSQAKATAQGGSGTIRSEANPDTTGMVALEKAYEAAKDGSTDKLALKRQIFEAKQKGT